MNRDEALFQALIQARKKGEWSPVLDFILERPGEESRWIALLFEEHRKILSFVDYGEDEWWFCSKTGLHLEAAIVSQQLHVLRTEYIRLEGLIREVAAHLS